MASHSKNTRQQPRRGEVRATEQARQFAKELRRELSPPERVLWSRLKGQQVDGLKFRNQHPLGPWIADFYCYQAALVVEVDGATHCGDRKDVDAVRDAWMRERGIEVLRVTSTDVFENLTGVLETIRREARRRIEQLALEKML